MTRKTRYNIADKIRKKLNENKKAHNDYLRSVRELKKSQQDLNNLYKAKREFELKHRSRRKK